MMHGSGTGFAAYFFQHLRAYCPVITKHLDLDQFMRFQADFDFVQDFLAKAVIAYHDHWIQIVTEGAQVANLFGVKSSHMSLIQKGSQFSR